ncbi:TetR/AcrR family transcriptional regulator [Herbaspirillum rhizosphaerae]|uniref:TetR/AcrR family transcriptional regulator n=1 Tax=Herbaspirillum rhizosphaerae TaxID=346179 RepID=A0ABW8Z721_9BURK
MRVKTEEKREAILAAASDVFLEAGFEGASMAEIAARIGGSKGTLYGYFSSKEELFVAVMHEEARKQFEPVFASLNKAVEDLEKTLQTFGEKVLEFLCLPSSIQTRRAVLAESGRSDIGKRFHELGPKVGMQQLAAFLEKQMDLQRLKKSDPMLAAHQLAALLECETVVPLMLGLEETISKPRIKLAVRLALTTFFDAYAIPTGSQKKKKGE